MATALFPVAPDPVGLRKVAPAPPAGSQVGLDWLFDYTKNDFVIDRNGEVPKINGGLTTAQQCVATLLVDRAWHRMFGRRHGIDYELAMRKTHREQTYASLELQVRERLKRIRGVKDVVDFDFAEGVHQVDTSYVTDAPKIVERPYNEIEGHTYDDMEGFTYQGLEWKWSTAATAPAIEVTYTERTYTELETLTYDGMEQLTYDELEYTTSFTTAPPEAAKGGAMTTYAAQADVISVRFTVVLDVGARYRLEINPHKVRTP